MDTKEKILVTSRAFFASYGYEGTTMSMIANKVGIKKPSLYSHYTSKAELFEDVLDKEVTEYLSFLKETLISYDSPVKDKLYKLLADHALGDNDEASMNFYYRFIKYQPQGLEDYAVAKFTEMENETKKIFDQVLDRGKEDREIDPALSNSQIYETYFLLLDGLSTMPDLYKKNFDEQDTLGVWELFYRGIRKG